MRRGWLLLAGAALAIGLVGYGGYGLLYWLRDEGGVWAYAWHLLFGTPANLYRSLMGLAGLAILVALLLTPLALAETRSLRAFARMEEEMRQAMPDAAFVPYSGVEGVGVAFDGPEGRILLLRPTVGIGVPQVVRIPPPSAGDAERPSPEGS